MASVLYFDDDLCGRVPAMQERSLSVASRERSTLAVIAALRENLGFEAITFEEDTFTLPRSIVPTSRRHSAATLVLFEDQNIVCSCVDQDEDTFDLIVPTLAPPHAWCTALQAVITETLQRCDVSRKLCQEAEDASLKSLALRRWICKSLRPIDVNSLWLRETDGEKER